MGSPRRRSVTRTFRLFEDVNEAISKRAEEEKISVSAYLNRVLMEHFEWERATKGFGMAVITDVLYKRLIEKLDNESVGDLGRERGAEVAKNVRLAHSDISEVHDYLSLLKHIYDKSAAVSNYELKTVGDAEVLTFEHHLGDKWSILMANYFTAFVKGIEPKASIKTNYTDRVVSLEIRVKD